MSVSVSAVSWIDASLPACQHVAWHVHHFPFCLNDAINRRQMTTTQWWMQIINQFFSVDCFTLQTSFTKHYGRLKMERRGKIIFNMYEQKFFYCFTRIELIIKIFSWSFCLLHIYRCCFFFSSHSHFVYICWHIWKLTRQLSSSSRLEENWK